MRSIYLDHHSATFTSRKTLRAVCNHQQNMFAAPFANHNEGHATLTFSQEAIEKIKQNLGLHTLSSVSFHSSISNVIHSVLSHINETCTIAIPKNDILPFFHQANHFEKFGITTLYVQIDKTGQINIEHLEELLKSGIKMVCMSHANPLTGVISPLDTISSLCKQYGAYLHSDITFSIGKMKVPTDNIDFISMDFEHIHGPKGLCLLSSIHHKQSYITEHTHLLEGACAALEDLISLQTHMQNKCCLLKKHMEKTLISHIHNCKIFGKNVLRLPNCFCSIFPGCHCETLSYFLNKEMVYVTSGGGLFQKLHHQMKYSMYPYSEIFCSISICLSKETTKDEVDYTINIINKCVNIVRTFTP